MSLLETENPNKKFEWLITLSNKKGIDTKKYVQRFWQTRSLAGTDIETDTYRGIGIISGRSALFENAPIFLASALVDEQIFLLSSNKEVLKTALNISQIPEENQLSDGVQQLNKDHRATMKIMNFDI